MLKFISNLLFPIQCLGGCGCYDIWLCSYCHCAKKAFQPLKMTGNLLQLPNLKVIYALGVYQNQLLKRCIVELKYSGYFSISQMLARGLNIYLPNKTYDYIVPVPMQRERLSERGFNQTALIAEHLSGTFLPLLKKSRCTVRQATLNKAERQKNLQAAFTINSRVTLPARSKQILLVDDVLSTGATLSACAKVLNNAGYTNISAAVIALNNTKIIL